MLVGYLDESGIDEQSRSFWIAGYLASGITWFEIERLWRRALRERGLTQFHMVEFAHTRGQFTGWSEENRRDLLDDLIGILNSHDVVGVGAGVVKSDYRTIVVDSGFLSRSQLTQSWWQEPYLLPFQDCLAEWLKACAHLPSSETIRLLVDQQDQFRARGLAVFAGAARNPTLPQRGRLASADYVSKAAALPLQAADLLVYELRKNVDRNMADGTAVRRVPLQHLSHRIRTSRYYDEDGLRSFVAAHDSLAERHGRPPAGAA